MIEERNFDGGDLLRRYIYEDALNKPAIVQEGTNTYILLSDDRGSVLGVADQNGNVIEKLSYNSTGLTKTFEDDNSTKTVDAYGNEVYHSKYVRFGFTGMYREPFTGKYHTHFREYDALHSVWLSRDPIAEHGGINLTAFCGADPINYVDPLGLYTLTSDGKLKFDGHFNLYDSTWSYENANTGL